jgi:hypothetical protein
MRLGYVKENIWYNFRLSVLENQVIVELLDENNIYLTKIVPTGGQTNSINELKILMQYKPDSIIVLKSSQTELERNPQLLKEIKPPALDISQSVTIENPEPEGQTELPEVKETKTEESNQEFVFLTRIIIIVTPIALSIAALTYRLFRKLK